MQAAVDQFLSTLALERDASPHTLAAYGRDLRELVEGLPPRARPIQVTTEQLRRHLAALIERGLCARSVARHLAAIRSLFRFLRAEEELEVDPCEGIAAARQGSSIPRVLAPEQVEALLAAPNTAAPLDLRDRALLEILYATGARASEAVGLRLRAVTEALTAPGDVITVRVIGKGSKERLVPLHARAQTAVRDYLSRGRPRLLRRRLERAGPLLLSRTGKPLSRVDVFRIVRKHLVKAGFPPDLASPHTLRHSFATHLVTHGADLRVVQELLGHARVTTTQVYTHLDRARLARIHGAHHPLG